MPEKPPSDALARPVLMAIDGHSMVYRAYFALAPQAAFNLRSTGEPIGAVFGFVNMLLKAWADVKPAYWAIAFDTRAPTFRDKLYADYKAGRPPAPDELTSQFARVREVLEAIGLPILEKDGYEADDIVGTLARQAERQGIDTVILTGDTDTVQLVSPQVRVRYQSGKGDTAIYDEAKVRERYGLEPHQMIDYKSLKGDDSDHIPGIPGVGEKTAAKLLQEFKTIDGLYRSIEKVEPPRIRELVRQHEKRVRENVVLVTIKTDSPVAFEREAMSADRYQRAKAVEVFQKLEFNSLMARLPGANGAEAQASAAAPAAPAKDRSYAVVDTAAALEKLAKELAAAKRFSLNIIGTSEQPMWAELVGLAFSAAPGKGWYVPVGHAMANQLPVDEVLAKLKGVLENPKVEKLSHDGKYAVIVLANNGLALHGLALDVTIAAYLLGAKNLTIKGQAFERLAEEIPAPSDLLGTGAKQVTAAHTDIERMSALACAQADMAARLWPVYEKELAAKELTKLFFDVEMPLLPVLAKLERWGISIDSPMLKKMSEEIAQKLEEIQQAAYQSAGERFNLGSPQQLSALLFEKLNLPKSKRTKTGYSTDAQVLESLRPLHKVVGHILDYREVSKLKSTYVDALPQLVHPKTHRVHTTLSQTVAATGRLSSSDPNLQNIPVRTETGKRIRDAFVVGEPKGWTLLSADYSQIELRVLAHISKDPALVEAFQRGEDIHASTASRVFNVPLKEVTPDQRRFAKVVNFGLLYGMGEFGLATRAEMSREEAAPIIAEYFKKYPKIQEYLDTTKLEVKQKGYVQTLLGRRRYIPEVNAANAQVRAAGDRMAVNHPIQGTAADVIKVAMIRLQARMDKERMRSRMILQVHDELIFETPLDELGKMKALTQELMPTALDLDVPLKVDLKQGRTWGEME
ncbi:MAG: DNA polymerase I [Chloroflexi bacterium]|nr:DNA polymerase I [Chloroflexota bacterium]